MRHLAPIALVMILPACATTQVESAQTRIARAYADYAVIKAAIETAIAIVPAVAARADEIHAWEARIDAAFAAARAAGDVAAAYAALREAQQQTIARVPGGQPVAGLAH